MDDWTAGNVQRDVTLGTTTIAGLEMHVMVHAKLGSPLAVCGEEARETGMRLDGRDRVLGDRLRPTPWSCRLFVFPCCLQYSQVPKCFRTVAFRLSFK